MKNIAMKFEIIESILAIKTKWDTLTRSVYQKSAFLRFLEEYNYCNQRYYILKCEDKLIAGAVVYSLKVNLLTFAKFSIKIPMNIIGIPASVDASSIIGDESYFKDLLKYIVKKESGIVLALNLESPLIFSKFINMNTLPTFIFEKKSSSWDNYLASLKHNYRRRVKIALKKMGLSRKVESKCNNFTEDHYSQYLEIMGKTKTKLEVLPFDFFRNLPSDFVLLSIYNNDELISWNITILHKNTYYFLFGGINYQLRDKFDSYYNNLISILKSGYKNNCKYINFGQTAEISKNRLGAKLTNKYMAIFHSNPIIRTVFRFLKKFLTYESKTSEANIYKIINQTK